MNPFEKPKSVALAAGSRDARFERLAGELVGAGAGSSWPFASREVWI
jgi:hypothetical protein